MLLPSRNPNPDSHSSSPAQTSLPMATPSSSPLHHSHHHHPQYQPQPPPTPNPAPPKPLELEVTVVSGKHLKNVNWRRGDLSAYVVAYLDPSRRAATRPDDAGGCKPTWNERLLLPLPPLLSPHEPSLLLSLDVFHSKPSDSPKPLVGSSRSPLRDLLLQNPNPNPNADSSSPLITLPLLRPSGRHHGKLRIRLAVRERSLPLEPQYPPPSTSSYYFPPPPPPASYSAPPQYSSEQYYHAPYYSAPPAAPLQYEYSTGPSAPAEYSRHYDPRGRSGSGGGRFGMGTGLAVGAATGALGGLAIEEGMKYKEEKAVDREEEKVPLSARDDYSEYRREY